MVAGPRKIALLAVCFLLAACASPREPSPPAAASPRNAQDGARRFESAAIAPLNDLNLVRSPIPPALLQAQKAPYAFPADASCTGIAAEVAALDEVLGADLDTPATPANPSLIARGSDLAGDALVGAVRSTAESVIPFRSWVRRLTGAERYSKEVAAAITAGTVRRSFLKGLGQSAACEPPAAPLR